MSSLKKIESLLQKQFAPQYLEVLDDSAKHAGHAGARGGGGHYQITLVSAQFEGKTSLEQHRLVYDALAEMMRQEIHALALNTLTPSQWASREAPWQAPKNGQASKP